jgi:hypothetical protein
MDNESGGKDATDFELQDCTEGRVASSSQHDMKMTGGGGGAMLRAGDPPLDPKGDRLDGIGNVRADGAGSWIASEDFALLGGAGGELVFPTDGDSTNDFFGTRGQLRRLVGGQGGGGGASLLESYYCGDWCHLDADPDNDACCCPEGETNDCDPFVLNHTRAGRVGDARGGGGGGGGGVVLIQALGKITLAAGGRIDAHGGVGAGGEGLGCSYWGGGGGGGAGGMVVVQSAEGVLVESGAVIDVTRGIGDSAADGNDFLDCDEGGNDGAIGDGGRGGHGLIQLQVPLGETAIVVDPGASLLPLDSWIDPGNTFNPSEFTALSVAISSWWDLGRVTQRPPSGTNPAFAFGGLDAAGFVVTDAGGDVSEPAATDVVCGYLGQIDPVTRTYRPGEEPRADFIPVNATIRVEFQGASAIAEGSKEVDPATLTGWSPTPSVADSRQFLRWRITFDVGADGTPLSPSTRLPIVESISVRAEF